jgi:hypothetical protein
VWLAALVLWIGPKALVFWLAQAAYAVLLLETINYIEHYGLRRARVDGRPSPSRWVWLCWNADHTLSNALLVNLQRQQRPPHARLGSFTDAAGAAGAAAARRLRAIRN